MMDADFVLFDHTSNYWMWMLVMLVSIVVQYLMLGSVAAQECLFWNLLHHIDDLFVIAPMIFVLQYTVFLIFSFSMLGVELMEESAKVSEAIYNSHWYKRKATESRLLLFMQMRSDRMVGISAANFFYVNRSTFAEAMEAAFSYFTVMQQFFGEV